MKRVVIALLAVCLCAGLSRARTVQKPEMRRVYIFGFAASFTDSIAAQTGIQQLDSAWLDPAHKFLMDRSLYSLQLQNHMESVEGCKNSICTVFFDTNPRRLQRQWNKVKKRYDKAEELRFDVLPEGRFRFTAEEYHEVLVEEPTTAPLPEGQKKATKPEKKPKKGKNAGQP